MNVHQRKHECERCGKCFLRRDALRSHRRIHSGDRAFPCDVCGKRFARSDSLDVHSRTHEVNTYVCHVCSMEFRIADDLYQHIEAHDAEELEPCSLCFRYHLIYEPHTAEDVTVKEEADESLAV